MTYGYWKFNKITSINVILQNSRDVYALIREMPKISPNLGFQCYKLFPNPLWKKNTFYEIELFYVMDSTHIYPIINGLLIKIIILIIILVI